MKFRIHSAGGMSVLKDSWLKMNPTPTAAPQFAWVANRSDASLFTEADAAKFMSWVEANGKEVDFGKLVTDPE
jgi:hypothetical protein